MIYIAIKSQSFLLIRLILMRMEIYSEYFNLHPLTHNFKPAQVFESNEKNEKPFCHYFSIQLSRMLKNFHRNES